MPDALDHDIRIWLSAAQYAALIRRAHEDDRPVSAFVRRLIQRDLDENLDHDVLAFHAPGGSREGRS